MTRIYLMTEAQHAQLSEALADGRDFAIDALNDYEAKYGDHPACKGGQKIITDSIERVNVALAMLKAMQPVEPVAWIIEFENGDTELHFHDANNSLGESQIPLYTQEQSK